MGFRVAQLDAVFTADTRQIDAATRKVESDLKGVADQSQKASGRFGGAFGRMGTFARGLGGTLASAGIGLALKKTADDASHLGEVVSFTDQVFKGHADTMKAWGDTTLESLGAANVTALEAANGFGVLFNAAGMVTEQSAEMSQGLVKLAADMSSAKDVPLEESLMAIRSGLVGESEPLRRFGILLNEAAVQQEALRLGLVETGEELTEGAKTQARYSLILNEGAVYNDNYADTADSMANKQRRASQAALEASAAFGESLAPAMADVYSIGATVLGFFTRLPGPVRTGTIALLGVAAALPGIVRVGDAIKRLAQAGLWAKIGTAALAMKARAVGALVALQVAAGSTWAAIGAGGAILAASTAAVYTWSRALQAAEEAQQAEARAAAAALPFLEAYGRAAEAGAHSRADLVRMIDRNVQAMLEEGRSAAEINAVMNTGEKVLARYDAAMKRSVATHVAGANETRRVSIRSLRAQWRWLGMNLEKYRAWAAGTTEALNGVQGSLGKLAGRANLTAHRITHAFDRNLADMRGYARDWGTVLDRGIAKKAPELTRHLQEMGLEGAGIVRALANANESDYGRIIAQWNEADRIADRTSRAVIRHTKNWSDETGKNMADAQSGIRSVAEEWLDLRSAISGGIAAKVTVQSSLPSGEPTAAGVYTGGGTVTQMASALTGRFSGLVVTSRYRPQPGSFHADPNNPAADLAKAGWPSDTSGIFNPEAFAVYTAAKTLFGARLRELIYGRWIYERGREGVYTGNDHWGHVHMADDGVVAMNRAMVMMGGRQAGGPEAAIPLRSPRGRRELARAMAAAGGSSRVIVGTMRITNWEQGLVEIDARIDDGIATYDRNGRRAERRLRA